MVPDVSALTKLLDALIDGGALVFDGTKKALFAVLGDANRVLGDVQSGIDLPGALAVVKTLPTNKGAWDAVVEHMDAKLPTTSLPSDIDTKVEDVANLLGDTIAYAMEGVALEKRWQSTLGL